MIQILTYILSALGLASIIASMLVKGKNMKLILVFVFLANALIGTSYLLGGSGINGAAACYFGAAQAIVNYFFDSKNKPIPKWLVGVYAVLTVAINVWVSGGISLLCLVVIIAGFSFIGCILQKNGKKYRLWSLANVLIWIFYDIMSTSYQGLVSHIPQLTFTLVGMFIHDRKGAK